MTIKTKLRIIFLLFLIIMLSVTTYSNIVTKTIKHDVNNINETVLPERGTLYKAALAFKFLKNSLLIHMTTNDLSEKDVKEKAIFDTLKNIDELLKKYGTLSDNQSQDFVDAQYSVRKTKEASDSLMQISRNFTSTDKIEFFIQARDIYIKDIEPLCAKAEKIILTMIDNVTQEGNAMNKEVDEYASKALEVNMLTIVLILLLLIIMLRYSEKMMDNFQKTVQTIVISVNDTAQQLNHTAKNMQNIVSSVNTESDNMSNSSTQTSKNVTAVAAAVEEMSTAIKEVSNQVQKTTILVKESVTKTDSAAQSVKMLKEAVIEVSHILEIVSSIAAQVNLLALNARIESARAGESGKGFTVVAAEVKNLANQTASATETITRQIENIKMVSENVAEILLTIQSSISNVNNFSAGIASAVEEQSIATNEISANMYSASSGVKSVSDGVVKIHKVTSEADNLSKNVLSSAEILAEQSEKLNSEMALFLGKIKNKPV